MATKKETSTPLSDPFANVDWEDILESLENQKCILFIGSGAFNAPEGGKIEPGLSDWLGSKNPDHPSIQLHNSDGFFLFKNKKSRRRVVQEMKSFYNQSFPETEMLFSRIARIPFPMIYSLSPDNILARTFDVMGLDYQPDFYFHNRKATETFEKSTNHKPLIYNLLGNIEEPNSLVLTHLDFFDYLQSVFKDNSMNEDLKDELEDMEHYIFLGLPYEKWYFQLLLRVLSLHSDKLKEIERLALKEFENSHLTKIYTNEFKIEFHPASTDEFIGELYRQCEAKNLLKTLPKIDPSEFDIPDPTQEKLTQLIGEAKSAKAIKLLKIYLDRRKTKSHNQLGNTLVVLRNRFNLLQQRERRGTIDSRDFTVENNQITEEILILITKSYQLQ
jgi:hypothetical protein